jgi:quinoprotein glucose dehydrogenase
LPCRSSAAWRTAALVVVVARAAAANDAPPYTTWRDYGGSADSMQYSALRQIDKTNVKDLAIAWSFRSPGGMFRTAFNPIVVDDIMYATGGNQSIVALNAVTGEERWSRTFDGNPSGRGITYWESRDRSDRRLLFTANNFLCALDARTGAPVPSFGTDGRVNIREGVPRGDRPRGVQSQTPGRVFENLIILGSGTGEEYEAPPGDIRAYDVITGKLAWTFHTIPREGEYGYDTWPPEAWKRNGGTNVWGEISIDATRGIAYLPIGSPTYDFYGANRKGANLFGNCLLALDARTGRRLWHFQAVHHDLWDYDLTTAPKLMTVRHGGKPVDVVAQATKFGFLYVFERETGKPLWPIEEKPVPQSDVPGEHSWPTQPFPSKPPPFARLTLAEGDINPYLDAAERERLRAFVKGLRNEGIFTPPSLRGSVQVPGQWGGANWGATAAEPDSGMLYVRTLDLPVSNTLSTVVPAEMVGVGEANPFQRTRTMYIENCFACHGPRAQLSGARLMSRDQFRALLRDGQARMPAFPHLTSEQVDDLFAFVTDTMAMPPSSQPSATPAPYVEGKTRFFGEFANVIGAEGGMPANAPPWAEIVAYDLNEGTIRWRTPLGTVPSLAAKGIKDTGSIRSSRNGIVATAGGLLFIGTTADRTVRAYDKDTGQVLWEHELKANPDGIPAVYEVAGRQYVAFFATARGGAEAVWKRGETDAQGYYVFALPATGSAGRTSAP